MATKRIELADSGVIFDPKQHTYELNGTYLSGITELLQRQLFPNEYANIPKAILDQAAAYGTSVHESCELFDKIMNEIRNRSPGQKDCQIVVI